MPDPADAVTLEVEGDPQASLGLGDGFDRNVDDGSDGSVDTSDAPRPWWIDMDDLGGDGPLGEADASFGEATIAHARRAAGFQRSVDDSLLPFGERVGPVA
jgi:hypothetical protein